MRKRTLLIPEEQYSSDFNPILTFYNYHVKGKKITLSLDDINNFGVKLVPLKHKAIRKTDEKINTINSIEFSSNDKKEQVKNLMYCFRCIAAHPENIEEVIVNGVKCYKLICYRKEKSQTARVITMKGLVTQSTWNSFCNQIFNLIKAQTL